MMFFSCSSALIKRPITSVPFRAVTLAYQSLTLFFPLLHKQKFKLALLKDLRDHASFTTASAIMGFNSKMHHCACQNAERSCDTAARSQVSIKLIV